MSTLFYTGKRKVHFLLENGKEMVEEYHVDTNVLLRRAWKEKGNFGQDIGWTIEVGDPEPKQNNIEMFGIQESSNAVCYLTYYYFEYNSPFYDCKSIVMFK